MSRNTSILHSKRNATKSRLEKFSDKLHALLWVGSAISVAHFTDLPKVLLSDERINRPVFNVAIILFCINSTLMVYLAFYLPRFKGIKDSSAWDVYCPRVIPTMTVIGIIDGLLFIRASWPVWGFLSPLIMGIVWLGTLFSLHFIPWL